MNSVQLHLALTHVPVILSLVGLIMPVIAFFAKNPTITKTSYFLILFAGIAALPVFFTGEGTEEAIENLPGVSEDVIKRHEEVAKLAMISIAAAGIVALTALLSFRWQTIARVTKVGVLVLAVVSGGLMVQTAHLGGQVRHTEIRTGVAMQSNGGDGGENETNAGVQQETHDD